MHFLSHYYYELPNNNPLFVAGLGIPDLVKGFTKKYNFLLKKSVSNNIETVKPVQNGVKRHYEADKIFHNSASFILQVSKLKQAFILEDLNRERLRLSVIAHLATELMIDRQIMLEQEDICFDYYDILNRADEGILSRYFELYLGSREKQDFLTKFKFFKERRFLFQFRNLENIVRGLSRIYHSVTGIEFTDGEQAKFLTALNNNDANMRYSWKHFLNV